MSTIQWKVSKIRNLYNKVRKILTIFNHYSHSLSLINFLGKNSESRQDETTVVDNPSVYFISLVATSLRGFSEREHYLYDVATEMELQGFRVEFLSTNELKDFYRKYHADFDEKKVNIYEMAQFFIRMHHRSSFFFDEVPFIQIGCKLELRWWHIYIKRGKYYQTTFT